MINNEEKFFSYLKGKMKSESRKIFEDELMNSDKLNKEFIEYKKLNDFIKETKNVNLKKEYSKSIIPEFRKRRESKSLKKIKPTIKYALASILIIIAGYFLISQINKENQHDVNSELTQYSYSELNSFIDDYDYSNSIELNIADDAIQRIDSIYSDNISASLIESISEKNFEDIFSTNSIVDVDEYLSDNEVDFIYAHLINKEIL